MTPEKFADELRMERVRRRIRQVGLADRIGVDFRTVSNWETMRNRPNAVHMIAWAAALGRTVPSEVLADLQQPTICGTRSGYQKHVRDRTEKCRPCRDAHAANGRNYREATR